MTAGSGLVLERTPVINEWVDYNGHMNDACYAIVFSRNVDALMVHLGMDDAYRERTGCSVFTLETHVCYLHEAEQGELLHVTTELVGCDHKRLRVFFGMYNGAEVLLATSEEMLLHVDLRGPRSAPFDANVQARVDRLWEQHASLPLPEQVGRGFAKLARSRV